MLARASAPERTSRWSAGGRVSVYQSESDKGRIKTPARGGELSRSMNEHDYPITTGPPKCCCFPSKLCNSLAGAIHCRVEANRNGREYQTHTHTNLFVIYTDRDRKVGV